MGPKILFVDDDPLMPALFRRPLEQAGYELLAAADGRQALDLAAREQPQVIIMDIMMPEKDGLSALRELKRLEATKAIPVIMITSHSEYQVCRQESEGSGAAFFLTKPFGPAKLLAEIQRLLGGTPQGANGEVRPA